MLGKLGDPGRYQVAAFFYSDDNDDQVGDGGDEEDLGQCQDTVFHLAKKDLDDFFKPSTFRFPSIVQFLGGVLFIICMLSIV